MNTRSLFLFVIVLLITSSGCALKEYCHKKDARKTRTEMLESISTNAWFNNEPSAITGGKVKRIEANYRKTIEEINGRNRKAQK